MSSVTRTPACTVKGCPAPRDPDFHVPICGHGLEGHHHHVTKRSQGGKDGPQVFICPNCHHNIDNGEWGNDVKDIPGRGRVYFAWDIHGNTLIERDLTKEESDGLDVDGDSVLGGVDGGNGPDIEGGDTEGGSVSPADDSGGGDSGSVVHHPLLTHEQRVAITQAIKDTKQRHSFLAGDTANLWEEELNDEFWSRYADGFGYTYPSLRNVMRVCKRIPPNQRHVEMSFAAHEATQTFDIETRDAWLERAFEEDWPVKRLREELVAEGLLTAKKKTKRYTPHEIHDLADEYPYEPARNEIRDFADWLGERDEEQP